MVCDKHMHILPYIVMIISYISKGQRECITLHNILLSPSFICIPFPVYCGLLYSCAPTAKTSGTNIFSRPSRATVVHNNNTFVFSDNFLSPFSEANARVRNSLKVRLVILFMPIDIIGL